MHIRIRFRLHNKYNAVIMLYLNQLEVEEHDGSEKIQDITVNKKSLTCSKHKEDKPVD